MAANGFLIGGSSAECPLLSHAEREEGLAAASAYHDRTKTHLIASVAAISTEEAVAYAKTAKELVRMMESTVDSDEGTGQAAAVEGYRVAVKTGTADIVVDGNPGIVSTVAGVVPAESPRIAVSVVLYNPKVGILSSDSAAPLFGEVTTEAVRSLGVAPSTEAADLYPMTPAQ